MLDDLHARGFAGLRVAGVDEVGRGPLAGPVVAAAVIVPESAREKLLAVAGDSKLLTPKKRVLVDALVRAECVVGLGEASVAEIDEINILQATFLAMRRALEQVQAEAVVVDGNQKIRGWNTPQVCVVGGDRVELAIACASVVAKVYRDGLMVRLAEVYPHYGWASNAGYGSAGHLLALQTHG
ncbi:MAG: ribonuclease HII, partial [Alphaproteobacteria bacterium]